MHTLQRLPGENCWAFILPPVPGQRPQPSSFSRGNWQKRTMLSSVDGWLTVPARVRRTNKPDSVILFWLLLGCFPALLSGGIIFFSEAIFSGVIG